MAESDIVTRPEGAANPALLIAGAETTHEFIRYFIASGVALAADVGMLWFLTSILGVPYLVSGAVAFLTGMAIVYLLSIRWVFEHRTFRNMRAEFLVFFFIGIIGLGLNELILWLMTGFFGFYYLFSKLASVVVVFSWNFGARKYLLFR